MVQAEYQECLDWQARYPGIDGIKDWRKNASYVNTPSPLLQLSVISGQESPQSRTLLFLYIILIISLQYAVLLHH